MADFFLSTSISLIPHNYLNHDLIAIYFPHDDTNWIEMAEWIRGWGGVGVGVLIQKFVSHMQQPVCMICRVWNEMKGDMKMEI